MMLGLLNKNHMSGRFLDLLPLLQLVKGGCLGDFGCFLHGGASGLLGWSGKMETGNQHLEAKTEGLEDDFPFQTAWKT